VKSFHHTNTVRGMEGGRAPSRWLALLILVGLVYLAYDFWTDPRPIGQGVEITQSGQSQEGLNR